MSYILEALKKSDQERQKKTAPGIQSVYAEPRGQVAPRKRKLWPYLLIFVLMLNIGLLFRQLYQSHSSKPAQDAPKQDVDRDTPASGSARIVEKSTVAGQKTDSDTSVSGGSQETSPPVFSQPPAAVQTPERPVPPQAAAPDYKTTEAAVDKASTTPELKNPADPAAGEAKRAALTELPSIDTGKNAPFPLETRPARTATGKATRPPAAELPRGPSTDARPSPRAEGTAQAQSDLEEAFGKLAPLTGQDSPQVKQPPVAVPSLKPIAPAAEQKKELLPEFNELPPNLRGQIPEFSFSMFVYSKEPASRLVSVKGQVMREGQEVAPGLKLETITPDGAILNFRGQRFIKKMF